MKRIFVFTVMFFTGYLMFGQETERKAAVRYLIAIQTLKEDCVHAYDVFSNKLAQERDVPAAETELKNLQNIINQSLTTLGNIKAYKGETEFRNSIFNFLKALQSASFNELPEIIRLYKLPNPTNDDQKRLNELFNQYSSKLEKLLRRIGEDETAFLVKYYNVNADTDQFCEDLQKLLESARDGFQGIKGEEIPGTLMGS
ncbi:MAG: hypothetical protein GXO86_00265, partial [Chlorobi bacterium]|nr:hypothetical protein [Chlorobiota bacterium]